MMLDARPLPIDRSAPAARPARATRGLRRAGAAFALGLLLALLPADRGRAADLAIGDPAPDFMLEASDGKTYRLSDFRGKQAVVIAWFPMAFTRGCTIECKSLAEDGHLIEAYDVTYFMASCDELGGEKGNAAFAKSEKAAFPILSDPTKETAKAYGVLAMLGYPRRWTFYVDKEGRIAFIDKDVQNRLETSAQDMAKKLGELGVPLRAKP